MMISILHTEDMSNLYQTFSLHPENPIVYESKKKAQYLKIKKGRDNNEQVKGTQSTRTDTHTLSPISSLIVGVTLSLT